MDLNLHLLLPEILVVATVSSSSRRTSCCRARRVRLVPLIAGLGLAVALATLVLDGRTGGAVFGHFVVDGFQPVRPRHGARRRGAADPGRRPLHGAHDRGHGEFYAILLFALVGVMLVSGVSDLMSMFVSLELVTIGSYVLAAFKRNDPRSTEAGLKYLVIGAVSSAILLFGVALVYGATGSVDFGPISAHVAGKGFGPLLSLGTVLLLVGLFFKWLRRPVPGVGARRLPGRAHAGHGVPLEREQERRLRPPAARGPGCSWRRPAPRARRLDPVLLRRGGGHPALRQPGRHAQRT